MIGDVKKNSSIEGIVSAKTIIGDAIVGKIVVEKGGDSYDGTYEIHSSVGDD